MAVAFEHEVGLSWVRRDRRVPLLIPEGASPDYSSWIVHFDGSLLAHLDQVNPPKAVLRIETSGSVDDISHPPGSCGITLALTLLW